MPSIINASTSGAGGVITTADASGVLQLQTASTTAISVDSTSASPVQIQRNGGTNANTAIRYTQATTSWYVGANSSNVFSFKYNDADLATSPLMVLDTSGNVGIGTASPATSLHIFASTAGPFAGFRIGQNDGYAQIGTDEGGMLLYTGTTERMRIDSDGVVYQNCTGVTGDAPNAAGGVLTQPNGNTKVRVPINGGGAFQFYSPSGGTGSPVGSVTANASSTSYNTSSDYRLKENIAPMTGALNTVAALKPVTYVWKNTGEDGQGFIAHELAEVVPDCVTGEKDAVNADGNPVYQGIDTSFLVATLTAAIQELKAIIDTQAERIAVLENK